MNTWSLNSRRAALPVAATVLLLAGISLGRFWVPEAEGDPAFRIFYIHVPIAITAYACFGWGAWKGLRLLWTREERYDLESYTAVHMGVIFGVLTLVTGSIWAKFTWGHWWLWSESQLTLFLILFLFYSAYFMLRSSLDPGRGRASISAVYSLLGVALIPVSFLAIRLAEGLIHPVVFTREGPQIEWEIFTAFSVCLGGILALAASLYANELRGKRLDARLRELREFLA